MNNKKKFAFGRIIVFQNTQLMHNETCKLLFVIDKYCTKITRPSKRDLGSK